MPGTPRNEHLRAARRQRGWSQQDVADRMCALDSTIRVSDRTVARWERGSLRQPHHRARLCRVLDASPADLGFPAGRRAPNAPPIELSALDSEDVKRRQFAQLALLGLVGTVGMDLDRLEAVLSGTRVDQSALDDLETLTLDLIRREATLAPASLLPAVRGHLLGLHDVLVWTPPALLPRAQSLAGQTALLAGYLMFKQEKRTEADTYWSLADRFGVAAGDVRLLMAVLALRSWRWQDQNPSTALTLIDRAASLLDPRPEPAIAAYILSKRAARHAEASPTDPSHVTSALRDLDASNSHLNRLATADTRLYMNQSVSAEVLERRAVALVHLDQPHRAATDLEQLLASIDPAALSWRSYVTTNLAAAVARTGDAEHACDLLTTSLELAAAAAAPRCVQQVRNTRQLWLATYDGQAVYRLDEQLLAFSPPGAGTMNRSPLAP
jgi:transcriptional regulator with XRE-family HTH domain